METNGRTAPVLGPPEEILEFIRGIDDDPEALADLVAEAFIAGVMTERHEQGEKVGGRVFWLFLFPCILIGIGLWVTAVMQIVSWF